MNIIFASSELAPFAKTGGLGDMVGALPKALKKAGHDCIMFLPKYKEINDEQFSICKIDKQIQVPFLGNMIDTAIYKTYIDDDIPVYFIENNKYYHRDGIYESNGIEHFDNAERFTFFSRGCLSAIKELKICPDIIHCHDWPTGLIPVYLKTIYKDDACFKETGTVFTIHNVVYQGVFESDKMEMTGLPREVFNHNGIEYHGKINFLKGGLAFSDFITTVSKAYANEIQTYEFGNGLDGILRHRSSVLRGIINGVDYEIWNPVKDQFIIKQFTGDDLSGKNDCKNDLLAEYELEFKENVPLIGMISRLDEQKGIDLLEEIIHDLMGMNVQMCLLGTGKEKFHKFFNEIANRYKGKVGIKLVFDDSMAHKIEAGADIFLMPSKYEPCGLNQLYSLKYGTIPVVRNTGGLSDTINEYDPISGTGNGFKFQEYSGKEFLKAVQCAVETYNDNDNWQKLIKNAMNADFSWERSAKEYLELYEELLTGKQRCRTL
ncbi:MAG: glycogen synthase GlgA [Candidatus Anammoxibacter sp.]